jgi:hypothetical protein
MLTDIYTRRSDAFYQFAVVERADCLPTPVNLWRWFNHRGNENCPRCDKERKQTLAHVLNEYTPNYNLMTKRHNRLADVTRRAVIKFIGQELRSEIRENHKNGTRRTPRRTEGTETRHDILTERPQPKKKRRREEREEEGEQKSAEIIEFSCPYGCISHDRDTLEKTYEAKKAKYEELARTLSTLRHEKVRVAAVIASSMGAAYGPSMKGLQKILRCNNKEMKKLERNRSETAILGSLEIWRNNAMQMERGNRDDETN